MHYLDRTSVQAPPCLAAYTHPTHKWRDVPDSDKDQIHAYLQQMQGDRCAYCEGDVGDRGQHIEHFRRRRDYPTFTFAWDNLFKSCNHQDSCGRFKDTRAGDYDPAELVNPSEDDPDSFFNFRTDGTISVKIGLSPQDEHRARETLRVFSLHPNWGRLRNMRKAAVAEYVRYVDNASADGFSDDDIQELITGELHAARGLPFYTAIRHVLTER